MVFGQNFNRKGPARRIVLLAAVAIALSFATLHTLQAQGVLRIAAVVNDRVISVLDVIERMKFVMFSTGMRNTPDNQRRLSRQILRSLVDEEMELQEANRLSIKVSKRDIDNAMKTLEERNHMNPGELVTLLNSNGISVATLRRKVQAEIAWGRTVSRRLRREGRVSDDAVDDELARIKTMLNQPQYRVSEILLTVDDPDQEEQVRHTALRLLDQVKEGASFAALARSFSQSTTASVGGDLGWIQAGLLTKELDNTLVKMKKGDVAGPIRTVSGYHLLYLRDIRQPAGNDINDTVLDLQQIVFPTAKGASKADIAAQETTANAVRSAISSCKDLPAIQKSLGSKESGSLGKIKLGDLPKFIQDAVRDLKVGEPSAPVVSPAGPVIVFVPCGRVEPKLNLPTRDQVRERLTRQRFELLSRQYLRDLRRQAYVDLRG